MEQNKNKYYWVSICNFLIICGFIIFFIFANQFISRFYNNININWMIIGCEIGLIGILIKSFYKEN